MYPNFINRKIELEFLEKKYNQKGFQFIVIYGRRRIGKSELIINFCKNKPHIYFLANKRGTLQNARRFVEKAAKTFNDFTPEINNFYDCFKYITNKIKNKRFIICIDEFSYLIEKDKDIVSDFQLIVDEILKNTNIMLILCGSSISMMEQGVLSYKSPLYGRRTGQWQLKPFSLKDLYNFFSVNIEEFIKIYSVFGDIPAYFLLYDKSKDLFKNIKEKILTKGEFLYKEGEILLREELREPETYMDILKAMGYVAKPSKIANLAGINEKDLPKYIKNLQALDLITKINPVTAKREKIKTTLYFIKDRFLNFWFKFVYPNISDLEEKKVDEVLNLIKTNVDKDFQKTFEIFCTRLIKEKLTLANFGFTKIGKQWGRIPKAPKGRNTYEIDIVALNEKNKEILFAECKWQDKVNAEKICKELSEKAEYVDWYRDGRKEYFAVFAKSFSKKIKKFEGRKVYCFDLKDFEKLLKRKNLK